MKDRTELEKRYAACGLGVFAGVVTLNLPLVLVSLGLTLVLKIRN